MTTSSWRTEHDSLGDVQVPADALWRAQTQRAVENFPVGGGRVEPAVIQALAALKGAAASAIYGSRAANGVVLITTKTGLSGQTRVTYGFQYGRDDVNQTHELQNRYGRGRVDLNNPTQNVPGTELDQIAAMIRWGIEQGRSVAGGRNFSVVHDGWSQDGDHLAEALRADADKFKLRRHGNQSHPQRCA